MVTAIATGIHNMLELLTFPSALGVRSPSPLAVKADVLLAISGLKYQRISGDVRKAPKGKFPVLKDGDRLIPDSSHIQEYLETEKGIDFDGHLTSSQRAVAKAFQRLVEDHFYFINMYFRWNDHGDAVRENFFGMVPKLMRGLVFRSVKKQIIKSCVMQGLGRHSRDEQLAFAAEDLLAIATQLGENQYFMGNKISSIDATVYGALHNLVDGELHTPIRDECMKYDNLVSYCARIGKEVFNDT